MPLDNHGVLSILYVAMGLGLLLGTALGLILERRR